MSEDETLARSEKAELAQQDNEIAYWEEFYGARRA
jgi:hypothetical protein